MLYGRGYVNTMTEGDDRMAMTDLLVAHYNAEGRYHRAIEDGDDFDVARFNRAAELLAEQVADATDEDVLAVRARAAERWEFEAGVAHVYESSRLRAENSG